MFNTVPGTTPIRVVPFPFVSVPPFPVVISFTPSLSVSLPILHGLPIESEQD